MGINQAPHCAPSDAQFLQPQIKKRFWTQLMLTAEVLHLGTPQDKTCTLRHCRSGCTPSPTSSTGDAWNRVPRDASTFTPIQTTAPAGSQPSPHSTKGHSGLHPRQVPELSPKQKRCPQHCRALHPAKENPRPQLCQDTTVHCPVVAVISRRPSPLPFLQIFLGFSKTQLSVLVLLIYFLSIAEPPF